MWENVVRETLLRKSGLGGLQKVICYFFNSVVFDKKEMRSSGTWIYAERLFTGREGLFITLKRGERGEGT